jgi:hypothetical protein
MAAADPAAAVRMRRLRGERRDPFADRGVG